MLGCSDSLPDDPPISEPKENNAPTVPSLIAPENELQCTDNPLVFLWNESSDPEKDPISYSIQVATNNSFTKDLQVKSVSDNTATINLLKGVTYYWRVKAKDHKNLSSNYSSIRKFYTEGDGTSNHIPYTPVLESPALNTTISTTSTTLNWSSSDLDNDSLLYDVYFGDVSPPPLVLENHNSMFLTKDLASATTYYWKIVVKDGKGGVAIGQIWTFKTN